MTIHARTSRFIVIEGIDGAGTTTQVEMLVGRLAKAGVVAFKTREPTDGVWGQEIRRVLRSETPMDPQSLALAFAADRTDHLFNTVNGVVKAMDEGEWVVCDRYVLSSLAYQASDGNSPEWIAQINARSITPDMTVFVDTPPAECLRRITSRGEAAEIYENEKKLLDVRKRYEDAFSLSKFTGTLKIVDGSGTVEDVADRIWEAITALV